MRKLYITLAIIGGLVPPAMFFIGHYDRRDPNAFVDLGLVFSSFGITILAIPIGIAGGLTVAAIINMVWSRLFPPRGRSSFVRRPVSLLVDPDPAAQKSDNN